MIDDRRQRSLLLLAGAVGGWLILLFSTLMGTAAYEGIGLVGLVIFAACWVLGRLAVRDIAERPVVQVDEYEAIQRARVRDVGYVVALASLILNFLLLIVAIKMAEQGDASLLQRCPHILLLGFLTAAALPTLLLVWRTREDPVDPEA